MTDQFSSPFWRGYYDNFHYCHQPLVRDIPRKAIVGTYTVATHPAVEPVVLVDFKAHVRVNWTEEDTILATYLKAARERLEVFLDRSLITQTIVFAFKDFTDHIIYLPRGPVQSVTSFKEYEPFTAIEYDVSESLYSVNIDVDPAEVTMIGFPYRKKYGNYFRIQYQAGYADSGADAEFPATLKVKIMEIATLMYEQRKLDLTIPISSFDDVIQYRAIRPA